MKSLAHKDWPYAGTPWEWRGFAKPETEKKPETVCALANAVIAVYQKQNFGPSLD